MSVLDPERMGRFLGIDFAPLNVPLENRLQTLSALFYAYSFMLLGPTALVFFIYLFFTRYWYLALIYCLWMWYDRNTCERGGRRLKWVKQLVMFQKAMEYFPIKLILTETFNLQKNYIFTMHPHGTICSGAIIPFVFSKSLLYKACPGIRVFGLTLKSHFLWPFAREYLLGVGAVSSSKESIKYILTKLGTGNVVALIPGGAAEVYESHPNKATVILKQRKGFVKLAIEHGTSIVPVYSFGETDLYYQVPNPEGSLVRKIQEKFKNITGFPLFLINGRGFFQYTFGLIPYRKPVYVVLGKPIEVEQHSDPSQELIDKYHSLYIDNLQKLFDEYKVKLGSNFKDQVLEIK